MRSARHSTLAIKIPLLLFWKASKCNHSPQAPGSNIQERCGNPIPMTPCILLRIHQYQICATYNPCPHLCREDWLSRQNHAENKDGEIAGMNISINSISLTTKIPIYMIVQLACPLRNNTCHLHITTATPLKTFKATVQVCWALSWLSPVHSVQRFLVCPILTYKPQLA